MTVYEVHEHRPSVLPLSVDDARALSALGAGGLTVSPDPLSDEWIVHPGSTVGVVTAGDTQLLIRPKIGIRNVLALMEPGLTAERWLDDAFDFGATDDLLAAMVHVFVKALDRALAQGLRRDYRVEHESLLSVRGRIDVGAIARRPGALTSIPCVYDDYTADIGLNRLLLAAVLRARAVPRLALADRRALHRHLAAFEEVSVDPEPLVWLDSWTPTRLDRHCEQAVRLGAMLLRHLSLSDRVGATSSTTFLLDMPKLVETFITVRLRERLAGMLDVSAQHKTVLDERGRVPIAPDLVFLRWGRPVFVADVKYKAVEGVADVSNADLYQLAAYAHVLGLPTAALITCGASREEADEIVVRRHGVRIQVWPVDLTGGVAELLAELATLSNRVISAATNAVTPMVAVA